MAAEQTGARMFANHLHALDVGAVNAFTELANELHDRHALPFQVRAVEVEAGDIAVAGLVQRRQVVGG